MWRNGYFYGFDQFFIHIAIVIGDIKNDERLTFNSVMKLVHDTLFVPLFITKIKSAHSRRFAVSLIRADGSVPADLAV